MKISILVENTACCDTLKAEHGLSLYIETANRNLLFDMGQTDAFAANADKMGVDLAAVDTAILSHGHSDHGGGIGEFLRRNDHAPLYLSACAFRDCYGSRGNFIGLDPCLQGNPRLIFTDEIQPLGDNLCLYSCNDLPPLWQTDHGGLRVKSNGILLPDDFRHEQYLLVEEQDKRILISGCSHKGIVNLVHWFRPDILVGGFHLKDMDPDSPQLVRTACALMEYPTVYYTGHCTGTAQYARLKQIMGGQLHALSTGTVLEF